MKTFARLLAGITSALVGAATATVLLPQAAFSAQALATFTAEQLRNPMSALEVNRRLISGEGATLSTHPGPLGTECNDYPTYISSHANQGLYVSVEFGYTGHREKMLRARAAERGPWEMFEQCFYKNSAGRLVYSFRSLANWEFVAVEYPYTGGHARMLRARSPLPDIWERFYLGSPKAWTATLESVHVGYYVSVELEYTGQDWGMLRARATQVGTWEYLGMS